ncbi:MAG: hypothetical protein AB7N73_15775 [Gemmatimonadales bacterium]
MTPRRLLFRLLFVERADGTVELDLGWAILALAFLNGLVAFDLAAAGIWRISVAAWSWYGSLTGLAFIAGATISRARLMAESKMIGAVAQGIATSPELPTVESPLRYREIHDPDDL